MELTFLGRGSAFHVEEGNTSAYVIRNGNLLLFDCGSSIFERIIKAGILDTVQAVYIALTHLHPDHAGSLGDLIFYCYYIKKIPVYLNPLRNVQDYLLLCGVLPDKYSLFDGVVPEIGRLTPVKQPHIEIKISANGVCRESADPAYVLEHGDKIIFDAQGYLLENEDSRIFYAGDTSKVDFAALGEVDRYYIDCCYADYPGNVHYNVENLYRDAVQYDPKLVGKICCMHFDCKEAIQRAQMLGFMTAQIGV